MDLPGARSLARGDAPNLVPTGFGEPQVAIGPSCDAVSLVAVSPALGRLCLHCQLGQRSKEPFGSSDEEEALRKIGFAVWVNRTSEHASVTSRRSYQ